MARPGPWPSLAVRGEPGEYRIGPAPGLVTLRRATFNVSEIEPEIQYIRNWASPTGTAKSYLALNYVLAQS